MFFVCFLFLFLLLCFFVIRQPCTFLIAMKQAVAEQCPTRSLHRTFLRARCTVLCTFVASWDASPGHTRCRPTLGHIRHELRLWEGTNRRGAMPRRQAPRSHADTVMYDAQIARRPARFTMEPHYAAVVRCGKDAWPVGAR